MTMANQKAPMAPSFSPISERPTRDYEDREYQQSQTSNNSPTPDGDPNDGEFRPTPNSRNQAFDDSTPRKLTRRKPVEDDDDHDDDYETGESSSRMLNRHASMINDDEDDEAADSIPQRSWGSRKRRASNHQLQVPSKKLKTPGVESEAGSSVISVAPPSRGNVAIETTETDDTQHDDFERAGKSRSKNPSEARHDDPEGISGDWISKEEHVRLFQEKRAHYNAVLKKLEKENNELKAQSEECIEERDKYERGAFKLRAKYDRLIEDEDKWFDKHMAKFKQWKQTQMSQIEESHKSMAKREIQKVDNRWKGKFDTQEARHKKETDELRERMKEYRKENTETKKTYEALEKSLKKETDQKIKEMRPEAQKELREKKLEISELRIQIKQLEAGLEQEKTKFQTLRDYSAERKARCKDAERLARELDQSEKAALDKASTMEAYYNRERRHVKKMEQQHKEEMQKAKDKFNLQYQNAASAEHRFATSQRGLFSVNQNNEKNVGLLAQLESLKNQKRSLEQRVAKAEDHSRTLAEALEAKKAEISGLKDNTSHVQASSSSIDQQPGSEPQAGSTDQDIDDKGQSTSKEPSIPTTPTAKDSSVMESIKGGHVGAPPPRVPAEARERGVGTHPMNGSRSTMPAVQKSTSSIFGEKEPSIAGDNANSVQDGGDAMEGLRVESTAGAAGRFAKYGLASVRKSTGQNATGAGVGDGSMEGTPDRSGSASNAVSPAEQQRLSGLLPQDRPWNRENPFKN